MPFLALLLIATAAGLLAWRLAMRGLPEDVAGRAEREIREEVQESPWRLRMRARLDPEAATGLALTAALVLIAVGGVVVGLLALLLRHSGTLVEADRWAARWGNDHASHLSTVGLKAVTTLGSSAAIAVMAIAVALVELRRVGNRWIVPFLLVVTLGDSLVTNLIKAAVHRARPTFNPDAALLGPSFPSGHSSQAAAFFAAAALLLARRRSRRTRSALIGFAVALAVAVACSRVLLDFHWVSDVVAGLTLGWACFAVCAIAFGGRMLDFGAPVRKAAAQTEAPPAPRHALPR
jgi:membrane-associated phospholipid phosphatase